MEDTLRAMYAGGSTEGRGVLILVLMEDTLRERVKAKLSLFLYCLNPCFNGRYSQSHRSLRYYHQTFRVLILVLMEDTLRATNSETLEFLTASLNPCFNGRYSQSEAVQVILAGAKRLNPCFNGRYSQRVS